MGYTTWAYLNKIKPSNKKINLKRLSSPKLIDGNDPEATGKSIKIPEEETLRCTITMNHYKSRRLSLAIECHGVDKSRLITRGTKPPNLRSWRARTNVNPFLDIRSPKIEQIPIS